MILQCYNQELRIFGKFSPLCFLCSLLFKIFRYNSRRPLVAKQVQNTLTGTGQWSILSIVNSSDRSRTSHSRLVFSRRALTCLFLLPSQVSVLTF